MERKIFDCFLYNDEIELLEIRINLLKEVVDYFVIVESEESFTRIKRAEKFPKNSEYIIALGNKIRLITLKKLIGDSVWARENYSRNMLSEGIKDAEDNDLIMISDVDEIPRPEVLLELKKNGLKSKEICLITDYFNFKFNYKLISGIQSYWAGPVISKRLDFRGPQLARNQRWNHMKVPSESIFNAGWHFSFLTPNGDISEKLDSHAHQEREIQLRRQNINKLISERTGFHDHILPGSVWSVIKLEELRCINLIKLINKYPELIHADEFDSKENNDERIKKLMWRLSESQVERIKFFRFYSMNDLVIEIIKRIYSKFYFFKK